ncbi:MAG: spore protease YyaC [Alicyclobacillus macrosporangiidus]|nr:spore protease YyaC [Alicyclobacillus macrosporangiidus]
MFQRADDREIVVVCVGTDRSTGDAFGPIIGTKLQHSTDVTVYGTLDEPVHAVNLGATLERLQKKHGRRPFVLAVDACLGRFDHVGQIILEEGPLRPGAGVKKSLPEFGDFTLTGVVNVCGFMEYFVLQNTRLGVVMRMTDTVVEALRNSLYRLRTRQRIIESVQGH